MERSLCLHLKHQTHTCVESVFKSLYIDLKQRISIEVYISSTPSPPLKKTPHSKFVCHIWDKVSQRFPKEFHCP